jgi:hypothetical protein
MLEGATVTITIAGVATAPGALENTATVECDESEAVTANNSSSATPVVSAAAVPDIPTATETGLMILALMLAGAGLLLMRAR